MEYNINLGIWNSIFAVPSVIVDEHIKLAGATQLKVILWILRHSGEKFDIDDISKALNMQAADVKDCMQYWVQVGVISLSGSEIKPVQSDGKNDTSIDENKNDIPDKTFEKENKEEKKTPNIKMYKMDWTYTAQRISENKDIAYLMNMADNLYGRMTSANDKSVLLFIHEHYGMPIEIIIMIMQYLKNINKCCTKYIQSMADSWWKKEIFDLDKADKEIKRLEIGSKAALQVQEITGNYHNPTEQEIDTAYLWINQWKLSKEYIKYAYEICINNIGKYNPKYMQKIIQNWHNSGILTVEQARKEQENKYKNSKKNNESQDADWEMLKKLSIADEV